MGDTERARREAAYRQRVWDADGRADPYLANVTADLDAYVLLERALCRCDQDAGLCLCGWDER